MWADEDPRHFVDVSTTRDGLYTLINANSKTSSEVWSGKRPRLPRTRVPSC